MTFLVALFGLLMVALGLVGVARPPLVLRFAGRFQSRGGLHAAMAIRLVMGVALILAAPESRAPQVLRLLGALVFVSGVVTPFIGVERMRRIVAWWTARDAIFQRAWASVALAFGAFMVWAVAL